MSNNPQNIVPQVITEFLEVAVHSILHARKLYPDTIFVRQQKYGIVVYRSIHPDLNNYISMCLVCVHQLIKKNQISKFEICFNKHGANEEKFNFNISSIDNSFETDPFLLDLESYLRIFLLRLNASLGYLEPLSEDSNFTIRIHTTESASIECMDNPTFENFPWFCVEETNRENTEIIPIQTIDCEYVKLQCYIETNCQRY